MSEVQTQSMPQQSARAPASASPSLPAMARDTGQHGVADANATDAARDIGWVILLLSAIGALWASWGLFPNDHDGNKAGTWVSAMTTIALVGVLWLRSDLRQTWGIAATALAGGALLLLGAVGDHPTSVAVTMILGGFGIATGALMHTTTRAEHRARATPRL